MGMVMSLGDYRAKRAALTLSPTTDFAALVQLWTYGYSAPPETVECTTVQSEPSVSNPCHDGLLGIGFIRGEGLPSDGKLAQLASSINRTPAQRWRTD
jgi:hypothetical protein